MTINILIWSQITGYITGVIKGLVNKAAYKTIEQVIRRLADTSSTKKQ